MAIYGYVRREVPLPTNEQLKIMGDYDCQEIFIENRESVGREELEVLMEKLNALDVVVIASLQVLSEDVNHIVSIFERLRYKQVQIISWTSQLHLNYYKRVNGLL